ncbi:MAG: carbohydrate kinase family protein [bacterium]|nr:carbohydrate kinase family protein [bacterium]
MKKYNVVGIGVPVTDIFLVNPDVAHFTLEAGDLRKSYIGLETGSKSPSRIQNFTGGSSANSLAALAKLGGLNLGYVCVVGTDQYSNILIDDLQARGIDVSGVVRKHGYLPGVSMIMTAPGGSRDRAISVDHGTGEHLTKRDLNWARDIIAGAEWVDVTSLPATSIPHVREFLNELRSGPDPIKIFLAPSSSMLHRNLELVRQWVTEVDALAMNDEELELLAGTLKLENAFAWLSDNHCPPAYVTRGSQGIMYIAGETVTTIPAVPLPREAIVNTTGAGDTAAAMFLLGLLEKLEPVQTLQRAAIAGAIKICSPDLGAKNGLPTRDQLTTELKKYETELEPRIFQWRK